MCYNCGCGSPTATGGKPDNITDKTFEQAAKAAGQSVEDAKKHTLELLEEMIRKGK